MNNPRLWSVAIISALLMCSVARADDARHLFILAGQSNMAQPLPKTFKECVSEVYGKDRVIVVSAGHPSQPIKSWYKNWKPPEGMTDSGTENNGKLYDRLLTYVNKAIEGKQIATVTFVWMQGEADAMNGWGSVYEKSFFGILEQFKRDLEIDQINFVVGRINDNWITENGLKDGDLVRSVHKKMGEERASGDWIDTDDLNRGVNPWGGYDFADGHFPPSGYIVMGQRFAKKACLLIDPKIKLDPQVFKERFIDSSDDVATHAAIGKTITGTKPQAKQAGDKPDLSALIDGRFGKADPTDKHWLGYEPSDDAIEFLVDLGEPIEVSKLAVNLLLSSEASANFPARVTFTVSQDGKEFVKPWSRQSSVHFGSRAMRTARAKGLAAQSMLVLIEIKPTEIRSMQVRIEPKGQRVFIDEVMVNPVAK